MLKTKDKHKKILLLASNGVTSISTQTIAYSPAHLQQSIILTTAPGRDSDFNRHNVT